MKKKAATKKTAAKGKLSLPEVVYWKEDDDSEIEALNMPAYHKQMKESFDLDAKDCDMLTHLAITGGELGLDPEMPEDRKGFLESAFESVQEVLAASEESKELVENEKSEAEIATNRERGAIQLATVRGQAGALAIQDNFVEATQSAVGENFVVSSTGLSVKAGATITKVDAANCIGTLASGSESLDRMRGINMWQLGDIVLIMESSFPDGEDVVAQVSKVAGKQKHTIIQSKRLCEAFPHDRRHPELTATHHANILNYRTHIKPAKLKAIIDACIKGDDPVIIDTFDEQTGEPRTIEQNTPWSCAQLRKELREASSSARVTAPKGDAPELSVVPDGPGPSPYEDLGFLYVDCEGNVYKSQTFNGEAAMSSVSVIDLVAMTTVDRSTGAEAGEINDLDEENWPVPIEEEDSEIPG